MLTTTAHGVSVRESLERAALRLGIEPERMWRMTVLEFTYLVCASRVAR